MLALPILRFLLGLPLFPPPIYSINPLNTPVPINNNNNSRETMSYFNCLINPYQFPQANSRQYPVPPLFETQTAIRMLSIALKNSIISYQQKLYSSNPTPTTLIDPETNRKKDGSAQKKNVIEILSDGQEQVIRKQLKISQKGRDDNQARISPPPKSQEQSPTSQELPEDQEKTGQRAALKGKGIKKGKMEKKVVEYHVPIPEIDMIETCRPPMTTFQREDKSKLRQALLRRQVFVWVSKVKKQKREVRMLDH